MKECMQSVTVWNSKIYLKKEEKKSKCFICQTQKVKEIFMQIKKKTNKNQSINIGLRKKNKIIEKLPNVNKEMQK